MIHTYRTQYFLKRVNERGYSLEDVNGCIVHQNGDTLTVDTDHPKYPKVKDNVQLKSPNIIRKLSSWQKAIKKWCDAGKPTRGESEVRRILKICRSCPFYNKRKKRCQVCGCHVNGGKFAILNKIRMATENCPKDKW